MSRVSACLPPAIGSAIRSRMKPGVGQGVDVPARRAVMMRLQSVSGRAAQILNLR